MYCPIKIKNHPNMEKTDLFKIEDIEGKDHSIRDRNKVFVNGIVLENHNLNKNPHGFTWDFDCNDSLSEAILSMFIPERNRKTRIAKDFFETLVKKFTIKVREWGYGDFMIHMNMHHWLRQNGYSGEIALYYHIADKK